MLTLVKKYFTPTINPLLIVTKLTINDDWWKKVKHDEYDYKYYYENEEI